MNGLRHPRQRATSTFLQATGAPVDLGHSGVHSAQERSLTVRQSIHRLQRHVDSITGMVDGQDIDCDSVVGDGEARPTVWRVPSGNAIGGGEEGEFWEGSKGGVRRSEPIRAIGAGNGVGRLAGVVVSGVISDSGRKCGGDEESDGGECESKLHDDESDDSVEGSTGDCVERSWWWDVGILKSLVAAFIANRSGEEIPSLRRGTATTSQGPLMTHTFLQANGVATATLWPGGSPREAFREYDVREVHSQSSDGLGKRTRGKRRVTKSDMSEDSMVA